MFSFFKKEKKEEPISMVENNLFAPVNGEVISVTEVSDPVFSQKMMGDGFAVIPTDGDIYSPVEGVVLSVFPTKHAIGFQLADGIEVLLHMGLETVEMDGKPFECFVQEGDQVTANTKVATCDLEALAEAGKDNAIVVVITSMEKVESYELITQGPTKVKQVIGRVQHK